MKEAKNQVATRRSQAEMFPLMESYLESDQSQAAFCKAVGLKVATFAYWLKKYRMAQQQEQSMTFTPLQVLEPEGHDFALEVRDVSGRCLRFAQLPPVAYLREVLC